MSNAPVATTHVRPPSPRIPRKSAVYVLAGLATALGVVMAFCSSGPAPTVGASAQASVSTEVALDPERDAEIREYEDRLRELGVRTPAPSGAATVPESSAPERVSSSQVAQSQPADSAPQDDLPRIGMASRRASRYVRQGGSADAATASQEAAGTTIADGEGLDQPQAAIAPQRGVQPATGAIQAPRPGAGLHRVLEGTIIDGILMNRLDGSSASPVRALVTSPVYSDDSVTVIPKGSTVLGRTSAVEDFGQERLAVAFHRLLLPNGTSVSLDGFRGLNQAGDAGLRDKVNTHWWSTFGASAAVGLIGGLTTALGTGGWDHDGGTTVILGSGVTGTSQAADQVMNRFLNRPPTVTIREGHRIKIYIASDLDLPAYRETR